tara:strand:- start:2340 stop:2768 length:429 start_codon:yes stop_codon:yes gene_type:complete
MAATPKDKILKAIWHPTALHHLPLQVLRVEDIRIIPPNDWLVDRSNQFGYTESFENKGMQYPIAVTTHEPRWVAERILPKNPQHRAEDGSLIKGYYVHVGNKRVLYAQQKGYTHIESYIIKNTIQRDQVKYYTHIPHTEIPK